MKNLIQHLLILTPLLLVYFLRPLLEARTGVPHKRALLVAVTGYWRGNPEKDARDLHTTADVEALRRVLVDPRFGFKDSEIKVLKTPAETTHQAILDAFRRFLIEPSQPGDIIYFHYSGHGSEIADPNDELSGRDQTLVPSDYISKTDGSKDIRDKEIAGLLDELKSKQPGSVLLTFDSCHSGTITRGQAEVRGFNRLPPISTLHAGSQKAGGLLGPGEATRLGYVVISACRSDQFDYETRDDNGSPMGSLSYALSKALLEVNEYTTYRDLFERVQSMMAKDSPDQDPQVEGEIDRVLMGSTVIKPEPSIGVLLNEDGAPHLEAGFLQGVTRGSSLEIYPRGTKEFKSARPIAKARVESVTPILSPLKVELAPGTKMEDLREARAILTGRQYPDNPLKVDVSAIGPHPRKEAILAALEELQKRSLAATHFESGQWDIRIAPSPPGQSQPAPNSLLLQRQDGSVLKCEVAPDTYVQALPDSENLPAYIGAALERESRRRLLIALNNPNTEIPFKVEIRLTPVEVAPDPNTKVRWVRDKDLKPTAGGQLEFPAGEYVAIDVRNRGHAPAYVTILDLLGDGKVGPIWPYPGEAAENRVPPGEQWKRIKTAGGEPTIFQLGEQTGQEVFMVIATQEEANFSPLIDPETLQRGAPQGEAPGARELQTPLGRLLFSAALRQRSRAEPLPAGGWQTTSLHFKVLPAGGK